LLIVDDDELELCLLADRLGAAGYEVATANNGAEAKRMLETGAFPVVITDYRMPGLDGMQLVEQMREHDARGNYFIMWSIRADEVDRERGFSKGVDDYVSKYTSDVELLARIEAGFNTVELRQSLLRARAARSQAKWTESSSDVDAWNAAAARLHAEIARARRYGHPLTVLTLHVEHMLNGPVRAEPRHWRNLVGVVQSAIRRSVDWVAPLGSANGTTRLLVVFPETGSAHLPAIRKRLNTAFDNAAITDEFAELAPELSAGAVSIDLWQERTSRSALNAASLVATAEQRVEKLAQRESSSAAQLG
jgi:DNA-binding response OmpR family regulator